MEVGSAVGERRVGVHSQAVVGTRYVRAWLLVVLLVAGFCGGLTAGLSRDTRAPQLAPASALRTAPLRIVGLAALPQAPPLARLRRTSISTRHHTAGGTGSAGRRLRASGGGGTSSGTARQAASPGGAPAGGGPGGTAGSSAGGGSS